MSPTSYQAALPRDTLQEILFKDYAQLNLCQIKYSEKPSYFPHFYAFIEQ